MRTRPNALDLIRIAREVFSEQLMGDLPPARRYAALMIANALGGAERELAANEAPLRAELERLTALYPHAPVTDAPLAVLLDRFNRQLAVDIRKGTFMHDRARREQVRTHLVQTTIERMRETNPKYLEREGLA